MDLIGGYEQVRLEIADIESLLSFEENKRQAVWRGAVRMNNNRARLLKETKEKDWADVRAVKWANSSVILESDESVALSIPEHCKYQFVIQTEGNHFVPFLQ